MTSNPLVQGTHKLESATALDSVVRRFQPLADALVADEGRRKVLQGEWLGHAVHPILTDVPLGFWMSGVALDLLGGERTETAADAFLTAGVVAAVPTAVTGWAEWHRTGTREKRVGVVHAISNAAAVVLFGASLAARKRGNRSGGKALGLAAMAATGVGGYLGGHLVSARKVSSRHPSFADDAGVNGVAGVPGLVAD